MRFLCQNKNPPVRTPFKISLPSEESSRGRSLRSKRCSLLIRDIARYSRLNTPFCAESVDEKKATRHTFDVKENRNESMTLATISKAICRSAYQQ